MITAWKVDLTLANFSWMDDRLFITMEKDALSDEERKGDLTLAERMKRVEKKLILEELEACGYNKAATARRLGISRQMLYNKMKQHGIE